MNKKVNTTKKNFNADVISVTPKRQLLAQRHIIRHIDHEDRSTHFFARLTLLHTPKSYALHFYRPDTPKSASSRGGIYMPM